MKYTKRSINGDAGEHLVASRIIYDFGFPCRLQNIDIGIDAEIEITEKDFRSTGNIVKAQIKSTETNNMWVYIGGKHIQYWNKYSVPVVIILVHLTTKKIFWHCIDNISKYNKSGSGYKIDFKQEDELDKSSKNRFIEISFFPVTQKIRSIFEKAMALAESDIEEIDSMSYDLTSFDFIAENYFGIRHNLEIADDLIRRNKCLQSIKAEFRNELNFVDEYYRKVEKIIETIESDHPNQYDSLRKEDLDWDNQDNL